MVSLINTLIPNRVRHRWNGAKAFSAVAAIMLVMALMPIPQSLRSLFASVPGGVLAGDIVVENSGDTPSLTPGVPGHCNVEPAAAAVSAFSSVMDCRLRDALALASSTIGVRERIVFDSTVTEIVLNSTLTVVDTQGVDINGAITAGGVPQVTVRAAASGFDGSKSGCAVQVTAAPLITIYSANTRLSGLSIVGAPGNGVEVVFDALVYATGVDNVVIENNFIGTTSRTSVGSSNGNGGNGVCVFAQDGDIANTQIRGNIVVNNAMDGIRVEGHYTDASSSSIFMPTQYHIYNNLIGNLQGNDQDPITGNRHSGITIKNVVLDKPSATIDHNIITNNGFVDSTHLVGDGITLLNAWANNIASNYIGTAQTFSGVATFPFPVNSNGNIVITTTPGVSHYRSAANACDGIGIRYYDHVDEIVAHPDYSCADPDPNAATASGGTAGRTYFDASLGGPSIYNHIYDNEIGSNDRNGIYIQSVACQLNLPSSQERSNLANTITGTGSQAWPVQSTNNSILQNSIFSNDNSSSITTGSGAYGIGIDLEDYATANLDTYDSGMVNTYWSMLFPGSLSNNLRCGATVPAWEPQQPASQTAVDTNITENDGYPTSTDIGSDADAGANRLINTPIIDGVHSNPDAITGSGAEGTVVELFQVFCQGGDGLNSIVPVGPVNNAFNQCNTDFWNESTGGSAVHPLGHGQGYRFLGSAYIPVNGDSDHQGTWTIHPSEFAAGGADYGVASFTGGIVTATSTAFGTKTLCWDDGTASACPSLFGSMVTAGVDFGAQRVSAVTGTGGLWNPPALPTDSCLTPPPATATFYPDSLDEHSWFGCAGSTSEFSPNVAVLAPATYSLTKTAASNTTTQSGSVTYTITATDTNNSPVVFGTGSLSDVLPTSEDLTSCTWTITGGSGPQACSGAGGNILGNTNFGVLHVTGDHITVTVTTHVHSGLTGSACAILNTVGTGSTIRDLMDQVPTESGSTITNHRSIVSVSDCVGGSVPHITNLEKLVSVNGGDFFPADTTGAAVDALRGNTVAYLFHVANLSGQSATTALTDDFPATLVRGTRTVTCWLNTDPNDNSPAGDTPISGCSHDLASGRFDSSATTGIQDFTVPNNQYLHILVTGYTVSPTQALATAPICNRVTSLSGGISAQDDACIRVLDPGLAIYKSVLLNGTESSADVSTGAVGALPATDVTYFIDVGNTSASALLNGLVLTDTFPSGLAGSVSTPWTCNFYTPAAGALINHTGPYAGSCTVNLTTGVITGIPTQLATNQMVHIRLTGLKVPAVTTITPYCNLITATTSLTALTASDTACFRGGLAGLHIVKTASPSAPAPGTTVTYTLTVSNPGVTNLTNVVVTDDLDDATLSNNLLPVCVTDISQVHALDSGVVNTTTNAVSWTLASLNSGATQALRFTASINPLLTTSTTCHNTAVVAAGSQVNSDQSSVDIAVPPVLGNSVITLDKTVLSVDENPVYTPGDTVRYRVNVHNNSTVAANGLSVRDTVPAAENGLTNITATSGTVNSTSLASGELKVDNVAITSQGSQSVTYDTKLLDESHFPLSSYHLHRGAEPTDDDFYPARVRSASVETDSDHSNPDDALSAPDQNFVSLGQRGQITFAVSRSQTAEKLVVDGDGNDFCVLEVDPSVLDDSATEQYVVEVSQTTHTDDFQRVGRINKNSNCFDLADTDLTWARYIRVRDLSSTVSGPTPGADINAVCMLHIGGFVTNTADVMNGATVLNSSSQSIVVDFTDAFDNPPSARDCRQTQPVVTALAPLPPPPPPAVQLPFLPAMPIQLPKTGTEALPFLSSGVVLSVLGWMARRRK